MPLSNDDLRDVQRRVLNMFMDTIKTFELINEQVNSIFEENSDQINSAINEYLEDFINNTQNSGETHPEELIYKASREAYQNAGFYGAQLALKERQVTEANNDLREVLNTNERVSNWSPFKRWIDRINNFLNSLINATGAGEALKELKDCLRGELPKD